ncbi:HAD family hydrolase [Paenibacillus allorhizosphaerae]|uniref:Phosphatase n=1 Tax=Paenibacillus allorhizosphaerae TaxID=2849866 RepID=A0ABM8VDU5_9BACL|nr:HAD family hydrolase [Paenibacillus allorhizosphaerae]CAG7629046.1 Putative phosphatase [Paenibacillus allorhizosphaerae]
MHIAAIVLDLDGTLLNSAKKVSPRNLEAVLHCRERGIPVIVATARPPRTLANMLPESLQQLDAMIYYNGAMVVSENLGVRAHYPIEAALLAEFVDYLTDSNGDPSISVEVEDQWYSNADLDYSVLMNVTSRPQMIRLEDIRTLSASKLLLSNFDQQRVRLMVDRFGDRANIVVTDSGELIQIMRKDVSKESAVARLCDMWGISMREVMVFGDDYNDIGLFGTCGYPVAMGNAVEDLKQIAYEVTATNDQDGVAVVLERILATGCSGRTGVQ